MKTKPTTPDRQLEIVRVLRIVEYVGPRQRVEESVKGAIHGEKRLVGPSGTLVIRAATIGLYPEILDTPPEPLPEKP